MGNIFIPSTDERFALMQILMYSISNGTTPGPQQEIKMRNNYLIGDSGRCAATGGTLRAAPSGEKFIHAHNALILNKSQAEAVYSAMCALNAVEATISSISMRDEYGLSIVVNTTSRGMWMIKSVRNTSEWHDNQAAFAAAYGLA